MVEHATALLKAHHKLLQLPGTGQKHPSWKKLQLIVAHFSGISKWKDYLQMSVKSSWHNGDQVRTESIIEQCRDGWNIAEDGGYHTQHPTVSEVLDFWRYCTFVPPLLLLMTHHEKTRLNALP